MLPKVNQFLYLQVNSIDEEEARQVYKSRIADIKDDVILMEVPIGERSGRLKRLYPGDELSLNFDSAGAAKNYFTSSVVSFTDDVIRLVVIKKPGPEGITKVQRRNFLRVPAELEVSVKLSEQVHFLGLTEDVGGGGVSFLCEKLIPLQLNVIASCWLLLPFKNGKVNHVPFKGEVVRVKPLEEKQLCMLSFTEITDRERQKVIRYCFERQLEIRKK